VAPSVWPEAAFFDLALAGAVDSQSAAAGSASLEEETLTSILLLAAGVTAYSGPGEAGLALRAPASAGALYPAELYFCACGVESLDDGLYHFAPGGPGLHPLWPGPLAAAAGRLLGRPPAALTFFVSALYWRSLWKYRSRAWRYCLLDAGHLLANLELAAAAWGLAPAPGQTTCLDFPDDALGVFLGLPSLEEAPLAALQAGPRPHHPGPERPELPPLDLETVALSARVGRDQAVLAAREAGRLDEPRPAPRWQSPSPPAGALVLETPAGGGPALAEVVWSRRSRRNFVGRGLGRAELGRLLVAALPADAPCLASLLVAPGGDLEAGAYLYLPSARALAPAGQGDPRSEVARACLDQMWVGQAALVMVLWADLDLLEQAQGPRVYRHALLAAGRAGQRLYLAATALGLGCCGVGAFYDRELAEAAGLPPRAQPLYVLACGPVKGGVKPR
jgi:SagB-type dehydrogenase family enzyme